MNTITSEVKTSRDGKTRTTIVTINGKSFQRKSPRTYKFAIIGRCDVARTEKTIAGIPTCPTSISNAKYHMKRDWAIVTKDVEALMHGREEWQRKYAIEEIESAHANGDDKACADRIAAMPTLADRLAKEVEERKAYLAERIATGHYEMGVFAWSQSRVNAEKTANKYRGAGYGLLDVEVVEIKEPVTA